MQPENLEDVLAPGLDSFNCSESVLPYFGLFSILNTDNPSASCHFSVITIFIDTVCVKMCVHVLQIKRKTASKKYL